MFAVFRRNPVALVLAVVLHLVLIAFLLVEIDWRDKVSPIGGDVQVVQAELVERDPYEVEREQAAERASAEAEAERKALEARRAEDKRKLAEIEARRKQQAEEQARKAAEEKARAEAEQARLDEIKRKQVALEKQQEEEKRRQAEEQKQREAEEEKKRLADAQQREREAAERETRRQAEEKARAEAERKERLAKEKADKERKAREAAEAKARADRAAREAELAAQFAAEQDASELARIGGLIKQKIEDNWTRPPGTDNLKCKVSVKLGSNGSVLVVRVVESSGSVAFDRSVEAAVYKADPLPMPRSERLLAEFRNGLTFIFDPSAS